MVTDFLPMRDEEIDRYAREFNAGTVIGIMARQLQSLRSNPVALEPLVWLGAGRTEYAETILGTYAVWDGHYRTPSETRGIEHLEPKRGAFEHYQRRVLSALKET